MNLGSDLEKNENVRTNSTLRLVYSEWFGRFSQISEVALQKRPNEFGSDLETSEPKKGKCCVW